MLDIEEELTRLTAGTMRSDEMRRVSRRIMSVADGSQWSQAAAHQGKALCHQGAIAEGMALFEQAWQRANQLDDPFSGALAAGFGGQCCMRLYDYSRAEQWYTRELDRPRARVVGSLRRLLTELLASARVSQGDVPGARKLLGEFEGAVSEHFLLAYHEGDWERAVRILRGQLGAARMAGQVLAVADCASVLGRVARIGNQRVEAQEYLDAALMAALKGGDLNRELFTRIELAVLNADLGHITQAKEQLERCQAILGNGEDWGGHRGSFAYTSALIGAAEHIRKVKSSDELWAATVERRVALKLPEEFADGFRAASEIFRGYHAPWEEAATLLYWARVAFASSRHRQAVEKNNQAFAIFKRTKSPQWCERAQTAIFGFLSIDSRASSISMGELRGSNIFRKEGDYWTILFHGAVFRLRDTVGMHYVSRLIANPGTEISALDLAASVYKTNVKRSSRKKTQSSRYQENPEGDRDIHDKADRGRARLMVTKRIKDAIAKIRRTNPELARHFASRIRTGYTCSYVVGDDNPQNWSV